MPNTILTDIAETKLGEAAGDESAVGIRFVGLGRGSQGANYEPTHDQTALKDEFVRRQVDTQYPYDRAQNGWLTQVTFPAADTPHEFVREVGFYDADGDLVAVWAGLDVEPRQVGVVDYPARHFLSFKRVAGGIIKVEADLDFRQAVEADLNGLHDPDGQFNHAIFQAFERHQQVSIDQVEALAQLRRYYGQSGFSYGRHYSHGGDAAYHRPGPVSFSTFGVHNHPNYPATCGLPEISAVINGYEINTRHVDYGLKNAVPGGAYLEVADATPPAVPPSVLAQTTPEAQTAEMREYLKAFALKDHTIRDYRPHFDVYISVLECWFEVWKSDEAADTFDSTRHQLPSNSINQLNDDYAALLASGLKPRFENNDFKPRTIKFQDNEGRVQEGVLRYRVATVRLGDYAEYPVHEMVSLVDDPATRQRLEKTTVELGEGRHARYRVNNARNDDTIAVRREENLLDKLMAVVPGLDGPGAHIDETFDDYNDNGALFVQQLRRYKTDEPLNGAYYSRFYSFVQPGAAGRRNYRFGYNDPTLFRSATTREEVVALPGMGGGHRYSWAIPLELIVTGPLAGWNPHNVPINDSKPSGDGRSPETAFSHADARRGYWYLTPSDLFDGTDAAPDPADTDNVAWMRCGDGQARLMRASGIYTHQPAIDGLPPATTRYPIAPIHHEGNFVFAHFQAVQQEQREWCAALTAEVLDLKTKLGDL